MTTTTTPGATLRTYVELTKPRIIELLLITTVPAMVVAADGWPGWGLVLATLLGGTLSAGGANTINQVADRDIDRVRVEIPGHAPVTVELDWSEGRDDLEIIVPLR